MKTGEPPQPDGRWIPAFLAYGGVRIVPTGAGTLFAS